jgi:hypothetical protein
VVRHVVVFTWKPEASEEAVQALADGLAALPGQIPEILAYTFGPDLGLADDHPDYGLVADFADVDAYRRSAQRPVGACASFITSPIGRLTRSPRIEGMMQNVHR